MNYDEDFDRIFYSYATGDTLRSCSYQYNSFKKLRLARGLNDDYDSVDYVYDDLGRLTKNKIKKNYEIGYVYLDNTTNIIEISTNKNFKITYIRSKNGSLLEVKLNNEQIATFSYFDNGYTMNLVKISNTLNTFILKPQAYFQTILWEI